MSGNPYLNLQSVCLVGATGKLSMEECAYGLRLQATVELVSCTNSSTMFDKVPPI